jgi:uncharacterized protein (DUF58 family)
MGTRTTQLFHGASLLVPTTAAWLYASTVLRRNDLDLAVVQTLGSLLGATAIALAIRSLDGLARRLRRRGNGTWLEDLDVLTTSGCWMAWSGAGIVGLSVVVGWASLSVVGVLGLATVHVSALWALLRVAGDDPWRRASLTRCFVSEQAVEGGSVIERLSLSQARIPVGFRLFVSGRVGPRWPTRRDVLDAACSEGEVTLERDIGPAPRGHHRPESIEAWLEDSLGLCHSRHVLVVGGPSLLVVLPRPSQVDGSKSLLRRSVGGHALEAQGARRLPTEGSLDLREHRPGDDARRIHWLRSLATRELVVRLPDELPLDLPTVEVVLDTFHSVLAGLPLASEAPHLLMDALVKVWLGVGAALVQAGVNVVLVVAAPKGELDAAIAPLRLPLRAGSLRASLASAQALGARVVWQASVPASDLRTSRSVVVSPRLPDVLVEGATPWVLVPAALWAVTGEEEADEAARATVRYPIGSADNRREARRAARARNRRLRDDYALFWSTIGRAGSLPSTKALASSIALTRRGARPPCRPLIARPLDATRVRLEALP